MSIDITNYFHISFLVVFFTIFSLYRYRVLSSYNTKLSQALNSFETLVESSMEGILIFDASMHCIMLNQASEKIFGYAKEELLGESYQILISKEDLPLVKRNLTLLNLEAHEVSCIKKDGSRITVLTRGVDALWKGEKVRISYVIDISEYKNLQSNLEKLVNSQVNEINQKNQILSQQHKLVAMGEMIGAIAHQWRQPLNALSINIQNLEDDFQENLVTASFLTTFVQRNQKIIRYMSKTIDDFRNFFRIDKQKQRFWVKEAIIETLHLQEAQLRNYQIEVSMTGEDFPLETFKSEFQQVILNLINNAKDAIISHQRIGGKLLIRFDAPTLVFEDSGGGIDESLLERIFEPYFTTKERGKGVGMGLYISKMIIEQHMGGTLHAQNGEQGARFTLRF